MTTTLSSQAGGPAPANPARPFASLGTLALAFGLIGVQSFGGGAPTLFLIRQTCLARGWSDEAELTRMWALVQISPGINLIKYVVLIGHELRGWPGVIASVAGLLLPSGLLTVLMTAGFVAIREWPWVKAALRGIVPATIGLSVAVGLQMMLPLLAAARKEGRVSLAAHAGVVLAASLLLVLAAVSPALVLGIAGAVVVLLRGRLLPRGPR